MMNLDARSRLAGEILRLRALGDEVSDEFYGRHVEWTARFGAAGRQCCVEDTHQHLRFLAAAVQAGRAEVFADYVRWVGELLAARNILFEHLSEHLDLLSRRLGQALPAADAAYVGAVIAAGRHVLGSAVESGRGPEAGRHGALLTAYMSCALAGQRAAAFDLVEGALHSSLSFVELYHEILMGAQRRLGEQWATGAISVAQEHMASAVTGWVAARLYDRLPRLLPARGRAIMTGVEGELHSLPAHFAADLLELEGWEVAFIGPNTPASAIQTAVAQLQPALVGISVTMPSYLFAVVTLVHDLRRAMPGLRIILGGRGVANEAALAAELGVELAGPPGQLVSG